MERRAPQNFKAQTDLHTCWFKPSANPGRGPQRPVSKYGRHEGLRGGEGGENLQGPRWWTSCFKRAQRIPQKLLKGRLKGGV